MLLVGYDVFFFALPLAARGRKSLKLNSTDAVKKGRGRSASLRDDKVLLFLAKDCCFDI